jgi:hypothetical protein
MSDVLQPEIKTPDLMKVRGFNSNGIIMSTKDEEFKAEDLLKIRGVDRDRIIVDYKDGFRLIPYLQVKKLRPDLIEKCPFKHIIDEIVTSNQ